MALFNKPRTDNGAPAQPEQPKSKWQMQLYHLREIKKHMSAYMDLNSMDNFDMQKGADFIQNKEKHITNASEEAGGTIEPGSIEEQIKDYIPKTIQREERSYERPVPNPPQSQG